MVRSIRKLAKFKGGFDWHKHKDEDEMFWVVEGEFILEFRTHKVHLKASEFYYCSQRYRTSSDCRKGSFGNAF